MKYRFAKNKSQPIYIDKKKHHTPERVLNLLLSRIGFLFRSGRTWGYPTYLVAELTNICNLKCPLCPTGRGIEGRPKGKMSFADFKRIIDRIGNYLYSLRLENWGEPLLNEDIFEIIAYANSKKITTSFNTNLSFLAPLAAERLVLAGLDHIKISLDGASQESYLKYRIGGDFNKVIENIKLIVATRDRLNKKYPFIEVQFIVMRHNENEIDQIKQLCLNLGVDGLSIEGVRVAMEEEVLNSDVYSIEKYGEWLPTNTKYSLFDYASKKRKKTLRICSWLWTSAVVNCDGSVVPCCGVYDKKYDFGNLLKQDFKHIWNGPKYIAARNLIGRRKKSNEDVVCFKCFKYGVISASLQ